MSSEDFSFLTKSQEMHLYEDQDVGAIMHKLLENEENLVSTYKEEKAIIFEDELLVQQVLINNHQLPIEQEFVYNNMPDLLPAVYTVQPPVPSLVSNEDYPGPFEFELYIAPQTGNKNPWMYSMALNKLFITMATPFPIDFKCTWPSKNMFIRATPIFSLAQHSQDIVRRCISHLVPSDHSNINAPNYILDHIIRCQNPNASYHGSVDDNIRLSVVVPLEKPQTGTDCVRILYTFVCKNSCPSGMNRKPVEVVLTLEDETGEVFGRHNLNVRVCSCPKRDKEKEEKLHIKENGSPLPPPSKKKKCADGKKLATAAEPLDAKEYMLPWYICGKDSQLSVLNICHDMMAGKLLKYGHNDNVKKCLDNIIEKRKQLFE